MGETPLPQLILNLGRLLQMLKAVRSDDIKKKKKYELTPIENNQEVTPTAEETPSRPIKRVAPSTVRVPEVTPPPEQEKIPDGNDVAPTLPNLAYDPNTDANYLNALGKLQQITGTKPTYANSYENDLNNLYSQIVNRDAFSYNVNEDSLYQQYADQYIQQGKLAAQDAMGQAAALSGGYANSYAQSVGQQAYQGYLQELNNAVPELYSRALDKYTQEGQDLLNQYAVLSNRAETEYAKYQDDLNRYYQDVSMAQTDVDRAYEQGYAQHWDNYNAQAQSKANAFSEVTSLIQMGAEPTADQIAATGLTTNQYNAIKEYLTTAQGTTSQEAVSSMSSKELTDAIEGFAMTGASRQSTGNSFPDIEKQYQELVTFLDDCLLTGRITIEQWQAYFELYTGVKIPTENIKE